MGRMPNPKEEIDVGASTKMDRCTYGMSRTSRQGIDTESASRYRSTSRYARVPTSTGIRFKSVQKLRTNRMDLDRAKLTRRKEVIVVRESECPGSVIKVPKKC